MVCSETGGLNAERGLGNSRTHSKRDGQNRHYRDTYGTSFQKRTFDDARPQSL